MTINIINKIIIIIIINIINNINNNTIIILIIVFLDLRVDYNNILLVMIWNWFWKYISIMNYHIEFMICFGDEWVFEGNLILVW